MGGARQPFPTHWVQLREDAAFDDEEDDGPDDDDDGDDKFPPKRGRTAAEARSNQGDWNVDQNRPAPQRRASVTRASAQRGP